MSITDVSWMQTSQIHVCVCGPHVRMCTHTGTHTGTHLLTQMESHSSPEHLQWGLKFFPHSGTWLLTHSFVHSFIHPLSKPYFHTHSGPARGLGTGVAEMNMAGP